MADFFLSYGVDGADALSSIISAQVTFAGRLWTASEWSHDCRAWVQRNRDKLSSAIASRSNKTMQPTCEDARD